MSEADVKQSVRQFYDRVGWQVVADGHYQNARYEDLRPVSAEYIHRCHMRVARHLLPRGRYLLDAGSGPVQYPEYLVYSEGYRYRVCVDISIVALQEARRRLAERGLYVVADVANLPFKPEPFEGVVSLHTLHHLPLEEQAKAYDEIYRVLRRGCSAVVVNGWTDSALMRAAAPFVRLAERVARRLKPKAAQAEEKAPAALSPALGPAFGPASAAATARPEAGKPASPTGTFIRKLDPAWLRAQIGARMAYSIAPWRSVNVRFLRALVHPKLGGRLGLKLLYWCEERFPRFFGEKGQYPMVIIRK